jgi:putative glutathione S-transferase
MPPEPAVADGEPRTIMSQTFLLQPARFASAPDIQRHGEYRVRLDPADRRPLYRFHDRVVSPGGEPEAPGRVVAEAGRFHLYVVPSSPWSHRTALVVSLAGLRDVVTVSYVHPERDGRGWAFREPTGPDPVNGFTLLRQAYEATEPGFDGDVSVPALWDRRTDRVVSNTPSTLDVDLATAFAPWSATGADLYPEDLRGEIDQLDWWIGPVVNHGAEHARTDTAIAAAARRAMHGALGTLDDLLAESAYLLGNRLTLADVRLWVTLVRLGSELGQYRALQRWTQGLLEREEFRSTTPPAAVVHPAVA